MFFAQRLEGNTTNSSSTSPTQVVYLNAIASSPFFFLFYQRQQKQSHKTASHFRSQHSLVSLIHAATHNVVER
jgi:hypothetical protein